MPKRNQVFVSYSHKDEVWLERLQSVLKPLTRSRTIDIWADTRIKPGAVWREEIERALSCAKVAVLLVSPNFLDSDFIVENELPPLLRAADEQGLKVLWIAISASLYSETDIARYQATTEPSRPLDSLSPAEVNEKLVEVALKIKAAVQSEHAAELDTFYVPYERNPYFTGRNTFLQVLKKELTISGAVAICGLGGIGKTQVAVEYAYRNRSDYEDVFWVRSDTNSALHEGFVKIAVLLGLPENSAQKQTTAVEAVKQWLERSSDWLLILDNADMPDLVKPYLPRDRKGQVLFTSRTRVWHGVARPLELGELQPDAASEFLSKRTERSDRSSTESRAQAELARELGYLPLALEQAGAYIAETQARYQDYLASYRKRRLALIERHMPVTGHYAGSVATTWSLNFTALEQTPAAADMLRASALLDPDKIPLELLRDGAVELGPTIAAALVGAREDPLLIDEVLEPLTRYSLIHRDVGEQSYSMHRLVQAVTRDGMDPNTRQVWAERVVRAVDRA